MVIKYKCQYCKNKIEEHIVFLSFDMSKQHITDKKGRVKRIGWSAHIEGDKLFCCCLKCRNTVIIDPQNPPIRRYNQLTDSEIKKFNEVKDEHNI